MQMSGFKKIRLNPSETLYNHSTSKERTVSKLDIIMEIHPNESTHIEKSVLYSILTSILIY